MFGEYNKQEQVEPIVESYENVKVFHASAPEGFNKEDDMLSVVKGYPYKILGKVTVNNTSLGNCRNGEIANRIAEEGGRKPFYELLQKEAYKQGANAIIFAHSSSDDYVKDSCQVARTTIRDNGIYNNQDARGMVWATGWAVIMLDEEKIKKAKAKSDSI